MSGLESLVRIFVFFLTASVISSCSWRVMGSMSSSEFICIGLILIDSLYDCQFVHLISVVDLNGASWIVISTGKWSDDRSFIVVSV